MHPTLEDASAACSVCFPGLPAQCMVGQSHSIKGRGLWAEAGLRGAV